LGKTGGVRSRASRFVSAVTVTGSVPGATGAPGDRT